MECVGTGEEAYSEQFITAVLQSCNVSRLRVESIVSLALRHLPRSVYTWSALRKVLMEQTDLDSEKNRALWYVLDALLKHAPYVFVPLMAPRLLEYVVQQMPWYSNQDALGETPWCDVLVLSWEGLLPPTLFRAIRQHVVQCRSGAELEGALAKSAAATAPSEGAAAATTEQLHLLREDWDSVQCLCLVNAAQQQRQRLMEDASRWDLEVESNVAQVGVANTSEGPSVSAPQGSHNSSSERDEEYAPTFVPGAKTYPLPELNLPPQRRRREARRRPRDDDF